MTVATRGNCEALTAPLLLTLLPLPFFYPPQRLFNPFLLTVATRGNCEALPAAALLGTLDLILSGAVLPAALLFGAVVHLR